MSNTYGYLIGGNENSDTKAVTRRGRKYVYSRLQTHKGSISTEVWKDGRFTVDLNGHCIVKGNVNRVEAFLEGNTATRVTEYREIADG